MISYSFKTICLGIYLCISIYSIHAFFLTPWLRTKILNEYYKKDVIHKHPIKTLEKQSYFFGMIGPNIYEENVQTLFDLFTGYGIINGVFFNNKNISLVNNLISTDKVNIHNENTSNITTPSPIVLIGKYLLYLLGIIKINNLGVANTAILPIVKPIDENTTAFYVLFERDSPYLVYLYHNTSTISTIRKMKPPLYLSGHSKIKLDIYGNQIIESIDYHFIYKKVTYYTINENLTNILSKYTIPTHYYPITHDFLSTKESIIIIDSPIFFNYKNIQLNKMPFYLEKTYPTFIHVLHKYTGDIDTYRIPSGFFIFHFAKYIENYNRLEIFASMYDNIDVYPLDIKGNYRKIILDKCSRKAYICNNPQLEKYNLDFPILDSMENVILRNIKTRKINGFIKVNDNLSIIKKWRYSNTSFCGEPVYIKINNKDTLIALANDDNTKLGKLCVIDMESENMQEFKLNNKILMGFHSIFISKRQDMLPLQ